MADLAHALRTPLSSIKGYSSSLLQPDISWPKEVFKEFLETIDREADRLNRVIDDLLDTVEAPRAELRLDRSVTTVETLLRLAEAQLITSESWNKVVRFLPPGGQSFVLVDQTRMTQVLVYLLKCAAGSSPQDSDLLLNAISSEGGIEISVRVTPQVIGQRGIDVLAGGVAYRDGVDSPQDQLDDALRLSVCRTLLAAHDVELDMPDAADPARLYRFILPVLAHNR
jgi:two-component system sensor histidine kinase KdpD